MTWKEEGLSNEALAKKFGLSPGGVKGLKARLRQRDPSLYIRAKKEVAQVTSPSTSTSTKRMTFWLPEEMIERIKTKATQERKMGVSYFERDPREGTIKSEVRE